MIKQRVILLPLLIFCTGCTATLSFNEAVHHVQESASDCVLALANNYFDLYSIMALVKSNRQYQTNFTLGISTEDLIMQKLVNTGSWSMMMKFISFEEGKPKLEFGFEKVHNYVIIFQSLFDLESALKELSATNSWNPHANFIGYIVGFPDHRSELMTSVVRLFWKFWVVNVTFFVPVKQINGHLVRIVI